MIQHISYLKNQKIFYIQIWISFPLDMKTFLFLETIFSLMEGNTSTKLYQINRDHIISYDVSDRKMTKYDFIMEDEEIEDSNWVSVSEDVIVLCGGMK